MSYATMMPRYCRVALAAETASTRTADARRFERPPRRSGTVDDTLRRENKPTVT